MEKSALQKDVCTSFNSCGPRPERSPYDSPLYMLFSTENSFTITPLPTPPSSETEEIS
jgi:hypothetical protein